jgi:membrane protein DedA with SNARE-associated domain
MDALNELATWLSQLVDSLAALVTDSPLTYLLILGLAALDPILPILPAEAAVTAAAVLAGQGHLGIWAVMLAAGLGAFLGDNIAYWIGRGAGRPLITRVMRGRTDRLDAAEAQFRRRGGIFVIVGRFIPGGRTAVSVGAGALHFPWPRFLAYDAVAAVVWAIQAALPGYLGGMIVADQPWLAMLVGFGLSIMLTAAIAVFQRWWETRRPGSPQEWSPSEALDVGTGTGTMTADEPPTAPRSATD